MDMLMRFCTLLIFLFTSTGNAQQRAIDNASLTVTGTINFPAKTKTPIFFEKQLLPANKFVVIDSASVSADQKFMLKFLQLAPGYYRLRYDNNSRLIIVDVGKTDIRASIDTASFATEDGRVKFIKINFEGSDLISRTQRYFDINSFYFRKFIAPLETQLRNLAPLTTNPHTLDSLNAALKYARSKMIQESSRYVLDSMDVSIGIYQTMNSWDNNDLAFMDTVMEKFRSRKPDSFILPFMEARYKNLVDTRLIGHPAPPFRLSDADDNMIDLASYAGKKVLLDFWASWCGPCIKEMKAYKGLIKQIEQQGIVIISISLDKNIDHWRKSLNTNQFPWVQLIDSQGITGKVYGIQFMPTNYLIDKDGKVIAKNITIQELISKK